MTTQVSKQVVRVRGSIHPEEDEEGLFSSIIIYYNKEVQLNIRFILECIQLAV